MIKVLQYGEGNFLRTFVDVYFDTLNKAEKGEYAVNIVKPITFGTLERFERQENKYHIVLRGMENGKSVENVYKVDSLENVIDPFIDYDKYISLAKDKDLKIIVSNTTEAGICYNANDKMDGFDGITYPAKLTKFLYERFKAGLNGLYLLPVELIDNNADELKKCVDKYIELWALPEAFKVWNDGQNFYCNTLVDRIVSGYPRDEETKEHLEELIGEKDELVSIGEPFGLWAVEKKGNITDYIQEGVHNIEVVLTNDIGYYKKRKVRVLNGSHTNLVPAGLMLGAVTVYDAMTDEKLSAFVENTLKEEIIPYVSSDIAATTVFANSVKDRFMNPFLNHQLVSISLNSISKWKARVLPSFKDYYTEHGKIAPNLTIGFSYLMALYSSINKQGDKYIVKVPNREIELKDDLPYLEYFANGNSVKAFMSDENIWGEDLTAYAGFAKEVEINVAKIKEGICLI
ncbi:MAG: tagaturonate reductase [Clostridiales bacterium]|nr:tagaturonate reductase [Clostridiales bacterium]